MNDGSLRTVRRALTWGGVAGGALGVGTIFRSWPDSPTTGWFVLGAVAAIGGIQCLAAALIIYVIDHSPLYRAPYLRSTGRSTESKRRHSDG